MDQEKIGKFIACCRKENNLTQEQVAEKLSVSNKTVSRWENGKGFPDVSLLKPLSELLNVSVNELLLGEKIPEDNFRKKVEENTLRILEDCHFAFEEGHFQNNISETLDFSFLNIITVIFIILKLTGTIDWSWIWVLSPLWINLILCGIITVVALIFVKNKIWKKHNLKMPKIKFKFF